MRHGSLPPSCAVHCYMDRLERTCTRRCSARSTKSLVTPCVGCRTARASALCPRHSCYTSIFATTFDVVTSVVSPSLLPFPFPSGLPMRLDLVFKTRPREFAKALGHTAAQPPHLVHLQRSEHTAQSVKSSNRSDQPSPGRGVEWPPSPIAPPPRESNHFKPGHATGKSDETPHEGLCGLHDFLGNKEISAAPDPGR